MSILEAGVGGMLFTTVYSCLKNAYPSPKFIPSRGAQKSQTITASVSNAISYLNLTEKSQISFKSSKSGMSEDLCLTPETQFPSTCKPRISDFLPTMKIGQAQNNSYRYSCSKSQKTE